MSLRLYIVTLSLALMVTACPSSLTSRPAGLQLTGQPGAALDLERALEIKMFEGGMRGGRFSPNERWLGFLKASPVNKRVMDLWAYDLGRVDAEPRVLVRAADLTGAQLRDLTPQERAVRERKRIGHSGIVSYSWCGAGQRVLFELQGDLYVVDIGEDDAPAVLRLTTDGTPRFDARCSPKGRYVSYTSDHELHIIEIATSTHRQLTSGASETLRYAYAEFVAQEEMDRHDGHYWSPDERFIAYTQVDLSPVSLKTRPRIFADRTEMIEQRYPAAGEDNALVGLRVMNVETGADVAVATPAEDGYLPRIGWASAEGLYVQWQSRDQRRLVLLAGAAPDFKVAPLLTEVDEAWVELHDDLRFLADGRFVWPSERSGARQLLLYDADGSSHRALTSGGDPVTRVTGLDEARGLLYYTRATNLSLERQLFVTPLEGGGGERRLTPEPGWHSISSAADGSVYIDRHSSLGTAPSTLLRRADGRTLRTLAGGLTAQWEAVAKPKVELVRISAADGTPLNGKLFSPVERAPGVRYPVIVYVYGGPIGQLVTDRYAHSATFTYLTQRGFGVFVLDNRGSGGRDRAFTRSIHHRFGDIEIEDQLRGLSWLGENVDWVDPERVGVFGWSYGGYLSACLAMEKQTPFAAAVSVAPVTDMALYDTHYTERYLGKPQDNPEVYRRASVLRRAEGLDRPFMLVHGMADDNVLFENSLRLVEALQAKSIPFELMVYPGRAHGLRGPSTRLHLYRTIFSFFEEKLGPPRGAAVGPQ